MLDKSCSINVWNVQGWDLDPAMLAAVLARAARHVPEATAINIYPQERIAADAPPYRHPGSIEWIMRIQFRGDVSLTVGCLQRTPESKVEFHS